MKLKDKEHYDLMAAFEKQFKYRRLNREPGELWAKGSIYQDGEVNQLFLAFRLGYSLGKVVMQTEVLADY